MFGSLRSLTKFRHCKYCGKLMWLYNRNLTDYCGAECLYKDIYQEKFHRSERLYRDISLIMDKLNDLSVELKETMRKYSEDGKSPC